MSQTRYVVLALAFTLAVPVALAPGQLAAAGDEPIVFTGFPSHVASPVNPPAEVPAPASWPQALYEPYGSPVFCDLNGDGIMEVATGDHQGAYVFDRTGAPWPGWPRFIGTVDHNPAVADIDEDGQPELAFTIRQPALTCLNADGTPLPGFPISLPTGSWANVSGPVIADVDGDGHLDIGAQAQLGVYFFDRFGHALPGWPYTWGSWQNIVWSAPAVADLDGNGSAEVVVGENRFGYSHVHVIRPNGKALPGWPIMTEAIFSSPAVGDLDGDGDLEIVVQEGDVLFNGHRLLAFHHDGTFLSGWPVDIGVDGDGSRSNPAIADVDGDGHPEIVTATNNGMLHIYRADGTAYPGYPWRTPGSGHISSVQVVDVDDDGRQEVFLCYWDVNNQYVSGWKLDHTTLPGFPKLLIAGTELAAHGSAHIADRDGDGDFDLCAMGTGFGAGRLCVFEITGSVSHPGRTLIDWPKIRRNLPCTGLYEPSIRTDVATSPFVTGGALRVHPNPVSPDGTIYLSGSAFNGSTERGGQLAVLDVAGKVIAQRAVAGASNGVGTVAVSSLFGRSPSPGLYFLRWTPETGRASTARVVIVER